VSFCTQTSDLIQASISGELGHMHCFGKNCAVSITETASYYMLYQHYKVQSADVMPSMFGTRKHKLKFFLLTDSYYFTLVVVVVVVEVVVVVGVVVAAIIVMTMMITRQSLTHFQLQEINSDQIRF
jgi:hypothetical protein